jgi:phosphatidylglycerophosphate synthase
MTNEEKEDYRKRVDYYPLSIYPVFVTDQLARPLVMLFSKTKVSPNQLTMVSFMLSLCATYLFSQGDLAYGAIVFHLGFLFDCVDGKYARWKGKTSELGGWLDVIADRIGMSSNIIALAYNEMKIRESSVWIWFAVFMVLELVSTISGKVITLHEYHKEKVEKNQERENMGHNKLFSLLYKSRSVLLKHRLAMPPVGSVEMIMLVLFLGPLMNSVLLMVKIAAIGTLILFLASATIYWKKELAQS